MSNRYQQNRMNKNDPRKKKPALDPREFTAGDILDFYPIQNNDLLIPAVINGTRVQVNMFPLKLPEYKRFVFDIFKDHYARITTLLAQLQKVSAHSVNVGKGYLAIEADLRELQGMMFAVQMKEKQRKLKPGEILAYLQAIRGRQ